MEAAGSVLCAVLIVSLSLIEAPATTAVTLVAAEATAAAAAAAAAIFFLPLKVTSQ